MSKEEKAYLKFKTLVNTYCLSNMKMTPKYQAKLDKAWNAWQDLLQTSDD